MILFLLLVLVAGALAVAGVAVKAVWYLMIIGAVLFLADLVYLGARFGRGRPRPTR